MKTPKVYEDIITGIEPVVEKVIEFNKKAYIEDPANTRPWTIHDEEYIRLLTTYKLVDSITKYVLPEDEMRYLNAKTSAGQIIADILINRDGDKKIEIQTEVILAGGYNIQCRHQRYITKVIGEKKKNQTVNPIVQALNTKVKNFTKIEKLEQENRNWEKQITKYKGEIAIYKAKTDEQIIIEDDSYRFIYGSLADVHPESHNATVILTEDDVNDHNDKIKNRILKQQETHHGFHENHLKVLEKLIAKNNEKIEKIKNQ